MMGIIDRYLAKLFLAFLLGGLLVFVTIFLVVDFMSFGVRHSEAGLGPLLRYYGYYLPALVYQMTPVACLLATLFTMSTLNRSSELVALFSLGMSLARVSTPILILVAFVSALTFWLGDRILPRFAVKKSYVEYVEIKKRPGLYGTVSTNRIWYRSDHVIFNIKTLDPEAERAYGLTLYYLDDDWNLNQMILAKEVIMRGSTWELKSGQVTLFASESSFPLNQSFDSKLISINEDLEDLSSTTNSSDMMSLKDLSRFIKKNKEAGLDTLRYEVDYYAKFGFAFAAFVMSLLGVPFSVARARSGGMFLNVGLCIGLTFAYWVLYSSAVTLGRHGFLPPLFAAWGPNGVALIIAMTLIIRLKK